MNQVSVQPGINLRVYGLLFSADQKQVLLIDEVVLGKQLIKFPGGGVEQLESPQVALIREFQEELGVVVELEDFFYVSPHFHLSFFRPQQLLALYWRVRLLEGEPRSQLSHIQCLWRPLSELKPDEMTHPLDQEVIATLLARCGGK